MSRIALVVRRVGGLEDQNPCEHLFAHVVRRVGGLEERREVVRRAGRVVRRVGGLEVLTTGTTGTIELSAV